MSHKYFTSLKVSMYIHFLNKWKCIYNLEGQHENLNLHKYFIKKTSSLNFHELWILIVRSCKKDWQHIICGRVKLFTTCRQIGPELIGLVIKKYNDILFGTSASYLPCLLQSGDKNKKDRIYVHMVVDFDCCIISTATIIK